MLSDAEQAECVVARGDDRHFEEVLADEAALERVELGQGRECRMRPVGRVGGRHAISTREVGGGEVLTGVLYGSTCGVRI